MPKGIWTKNWRKSQRRAFLRLKCYLRIYEIDYGQRLNDFLFPGWDFHQIERDQATSTLLKNLEPLFNDEKKIELLFYDKFSSLVHLQKEIRKALIDQHHHKFIFFFSYYSFFNNRSDSLILNNQKII